jgi:spore germination protein KA
MKISKNIKENINNIKNIYGNSGDLVNRTITIKNKKIAYIYLESVSSDDKISDFLMKNLSSLVKENSLNIFNDLFKKLENTIYNSNLSVINDSNELIYKLSSGFTIIFIDGFDKVITVETRTTLDRGITESSSESVIRGSKDSFTENHQKNLGLIRKRIKDENLWFKDLKIGTRTKTKVTISYINDIAIKENVKKIEDTLKKINIDGILDSGYIREFLTKNDKSSFPQMISTEKPGLLIDFLHNPEDYYQKPVNVSLTRMLRFLSFVLTIITPGFYIAVTTWNQEVIPNELLISLSIQKDGVPFPTALELILMITIFEILREADIRMPNTAGASISIVGALILGEAAVSAGIVSPIIIIVVAFTSISGLLYTDIDFINGIRWWRLIFIIFSTLLGYIGLTVAFLIFIVKISSMEFLNIPYTIPTSPIYPKMLKDSFIRISRSKIKNRAPYLTKNKIRMEENK